MVLKEFRMFLKEYKVIGLAVAFVMGAATTNLVQSLVNNIIMPLINPLIPNGAWDSATLSIGAITLRWGVFLSALIHFVILSFIIFFVVKKVLDDKPAKK